MPNRSAKAGTALGLLVALLSISAIRSIAQAPVFTTFYSFSAVSSTSPYNNADGAGPNALIQGSNGNFYGTAGGGGANGSGTIFRITPTGTFTTLYSFSAHGSSGSTNTDGWHPDGLIQASDGNLYGNCNGGGAYGDGTIFKLTLSGVFTTLHSFNGNDGREPNALIQASDGNLYGTTFSGPYGTIFKITTAGTFTTLYSFNDGTDGAYPVAGLVQASDGNLYGTAMKGANGNGTIFKITTGGAFTTLHSFSAVSSNTGINTDGANPLAAPMQASDGNLYGTCYGGGANGDGTIFKLTLSGVFTTLYSFSRPTDGSYPMYGLIQASDGNLYGTTSSYGPNNAGTIFKITTAGAFTALYSFSEPGGYVNHPHPGLIQANDGNLYGTTGGGANGTGMIFVLDVGLSTPTLSSLSPSSANAAGPGFTLTLKGTTFSSTDSVHWTQGTTTTNLSTIYVSASELKAVVPASLIATTGKATVTVVTSEGDSSDSKTFTIKVTTLKLTSASLTRNSDGSYTATITLKNEGYQSAPNVTITKTSLGTAATSTALPVSLGSIAAGATGSSALSFPATAGSAGTAVSLKVAGAFTGGTFSGSLKVTLP